MFWWFLNKIKNLRYIPWIIKDYIDIKKQLKKNKDFKITKIFPIVSDKTAQSWVSSGFYFYQDLLAARRIFENHPEKHVDIGSRIDWFVAHVASFREIEVFDIRPQKSQVKNIKYKQADLMELPEWLTNYTDSISSLSVIEHFGLWRYSDPIDINWHIKWLNNIYQILKKWGKFYFSVPIGPQRIEFNAHRVFDIKYLSKLFEGKFKIDSFSYVDDEWDLHENVYLTKEHIHNNFWCIFANGIFELTKI